MKDRIAVFMLDVGQGDCTLVRLPDDGAVVFDCADDHVLRKTLDGWNTPPIEAFVLSHLDQDHIAGALQFLQEYRGEIRHVYAAPDRDVRDDHEQAKRAKALLDHVKEQSLDDGARSRRWELHYSTRDTRPIVSGDGWAVRLLAPPPAKHIEREREGAWEEPNRYSAIMQIEAGGNRMLIGGDAPLLSWGQIRADERPAKVFRVPHHGGAINDGGVPPGWDVDRLYAEVAAETALISVGTNNPHGHPKEDWIKPVTRDACRLLCTQVTARCHPPIDVTRADGTVTPDRDGIDELRKRIITRNHQWTEPQYRHLTDKRQQVKSSLLEVPCAGTVVVTFYLDGKVEVLPVRGGRHDEIVDDWERPLCRA